MSLPSQRFAIISLQGPAPANTNKPAKTKKPTKTKAAKPPVVGTHDWWQRLSKTDQAAYIKQYPGSKFAGSPPYTGKGTPEEQKAAKSVNKAKNPKTNSRKAQANGNKPKGRNIPKHKATPGTFAKIMHKIFGGGKQTKRTVGTIKAKLGAKGTRKANKVIAGLRDFISKAHEADKNLEGKVYKAGTTAIKATGKFLWKHKKTIAKVLGVGLLAAGIIGAGFVFGPHIALLAHHILSEHKEAIMGIFAGAAAAEYMHEHHDNKADEDLDKREEDIKKREAAVEEKEKAAKAKETKSFDELIASIFVEAKGSKQSESKGAKDKEAEDNNKPKDKAPEKDSKDKKSDDESENTEDPSTDDNIKWVMSKFVDYLKTLDPNMKVENDYKSTMKRVESRYEPEFYLV